jgi:hypothetical protein
MTYDLITDPHKSPATTSQVADAVIKELKG